jgi:hypothetical protein
MMKVNNPIDAMPEDVAEGLRRHAEELLDDTRPLNPAAEPARYPTERYCKWKGEMFLWSEDALKQIRRIDPFVRPLPKTASLAERRAWHADLVTCVGALKRDELNDIVVQMVTLMLSVPKLDLPEMRALENWDGVSPIRIVEGQEG